MMEIQRKRLEDLHLADRNVRKHTDKQIAEYIRSLRMFGQVKPIVVDGSGEIICGNGLYAALVEMGETECECYVRDDLTPNQKKKLMLADNRVYELGITNIDTFEEIIRELGDDIDVPGWDDDLLSALTATTPEVDELVSSYGSFAPQDTERIKKVEQRAAETPVQPTQYTAAPLQRPSSGFVPQMPIADSPGEPTQEAATTGQISRYVVCPKCGERICL